MPDDRADRLGLSRIAQCRIQIGCGSEGGTTDTGSTITRVGPALLSAA